MTRGTVLATATPPKTSAQATQNPVPGSSVNITAPPAAAISGTVNCATAARAAPNCGTTAYHSA